VLPPELESSWAITATINACFELRPQYSFPTLTAPGVGSIQRETALAAAPGQSSSPHRASWNTLMNVYIPMRRYPHVEEKTIMYFY
jgi:hypothetical protein